MLAHCALKDTISPWLQNNFASFKKYLNQGVPLNVKKGTTILLPGENAKYVYFILSGKVKCSLVHANGSEKILFILDSNSAIVENIDILDSSSSLHISTLTHCTLIRFTTEQFFKFVATDPTFQADFHSLINTKYKLLLSIHHSFIFYPPHHRLCRLLCTLGAHLGLSSANHIIININLTQNNLANMLGVSRVTIANILREMRDNGHIEVINKRYTLNKTLCQYCQGLLN